SDAMPAAFVPSDVAPEFELDDVVEPDDPLPGVLPAGDDESDAFSGVPVGGDELDDLDALALADDLLMPAVSFSSAEGADDEPAPLPQIAPAPEPVLVIEPEEPPEPDDLDEPEPDERFGPPEGLHDAGGDLEVEMLEVEDIVITGFDEAAPGHSELDGEAADSAGSPRPVPPPLRSGEHTSEL